MTINIIMSYCSSIKCIAKTRKLTVNDKKEKNVYIPLRLLMCGHCICEACLLNTHKNQLDFVKCGKCSFITTVNEQFMQTLNKYSDDISQWIDGSGTQLLRHDSADRCDQLPFDSHSLAEAFLSGNVTIVKSAECIDLDEDGGTNIMADPKINAAIAEPIDDDRPVSIIAARIPKTAPKGFFDTINMGIEAYQNSRKRKSLMQEIDEIDAAFDKTIRNAREHYHYLHSLIELRENEFLETANDAKKKRIDKVKQQYDELINKRKQLKSLLLQSPQIQMDNEREIHRQKIIPLERDLSIPYVSSADKIFKVEFKSEVKESIKESIKNYGAIPKKVKHIQITNVKMNEVNHETPQTSNHIQNDVSTIITPMRETEIGVLQMEAATVSSINDINSFYVQMFSDDSKFDELQIKINEFGTNEYLHAPAFESIAINDYVLVYSDVQKYWCRSRVLMTHHKHISNIGRQKNNFVASVFLIDYGTKEDIVWPNIREMKPEISIDFCKPLAYKCMLYNVKPFGRSQNWNITANELFYKFAFAKDVCVVMFKITDGIMNVDLYHHHEEKNKISNGVSSIIQTLLYYQYAMFIAEPIDFSRYIPSNNKINKYPFPKKVQRGESISVLVSHVESPDYFSVQFQRSHSELIKLIEDLKVYNQLDDYTYRYHCPKIGTPCVAKFSGDDNYYRAIIENVTVDANGHIRTSVRFVDFGNTEIVDNSKIRVIMDKFINLPIQAIYCRLADVAPAHGFKWSSNAIDHFKYSTSNERGPKVLSMLVISIENKTGTCCVMLKTFDGTHEVNINTTLVEEKCAKSVGPNSRPKSELNDISDPMINESDRVLQNHTLTELPYDVKALTVLSEVFERNKIAKMEKRDALIKVLIAHVVDPYNFYIHIDIPELKEFYRNLLSKLNNEYNRPEYKSMKNVKFRKSDLCAFRTIDMNEWRRGLVIERVNVHSEESEESQYEIVSIDYGSEHIVNESDMRPMDSYFKKDGPMFVKCQIHNIKPAGHKNWSLTAKDKFDADIKRFEKELYILIKIDGKIEREPINVKLYGKEVIIPGALDPEKIIYNSIGQSLVDAGLAVTKRIPSPTTGKYEEDKDDEEINEEPQYNDSIRSQMPFSLSCENSILSQLQVTEDNLEEGKYFQYLEAENPTTKEFYGLGTNVDNDHIWFRLCDDTNPLHKINNSITARIVANTKLHSFTGPFTLFNACTAYFEFDKTWNRAEILGISSSVDNSGITVRYVDYGNTDILLVENISCELFGAEIPRLALKCQLFNAKPFNNDIETIRKLRDEIYTAIVDHRCKFIWENAFEMPMKVTIILEDESDLRTLLLNKDLIVEELLDDTYIPMEVIRSIDALRRSEFNLNPFKFKSSQFYHVIIAHQLIYNYLYFQFIETHEKTDDAKIINNQYDTFMWMIEAFRKQIKQYAIISDLRPGQQCYARYSDDAWYRGLILSVHTDNVSADILFVDYGNIEKVSIERIRHIDDEHRSVPVYAFFCKLYNVRPVKKRMWRPEINKKIKDHINRLDDENITLIVKIKNERQPYDADLYIADPNNLNVPLKHAFQDLVNSGVLEFININHVETRENVLKCIEIPEKKH